MPHDFRRVEEHYIYLRSCIKSYFTHMYKR
jgi:hypothetical protein